MQTHTNTAHTDTDTHAHTHTCTHTHTHTKCAYIPLSLVIDPRIPLGYNTSFEVDRNRTTGLGTLLGTFSAHWKVFAAVDQIEMSLIPVRDGIPDYTGSRNLQKLEDISVITHIILC